MTPDRRGFLKSGMAALFTTASLLRAQPIWAGGLKVGQPAPPLVLHALDGTTIALRDLLGRVVIATFWATWCDPCREELPLLSDYLSRNAKRGLSILGFALDDAEDLSKVRNVAAHLSFPVGLLGSPWAGDYGRIWRIPVSFVIDRDGRLVNNGWEDDEPVWTKARLQQVVDPLLLPADPASTSSRDDQ